MDLRNPTNSRFRLSRGLREAASRVQRLTTHPLLIWAGLRSPRPQHTRREGLALSRYARGRRRLVEIGVAAGCSAALLRGAMAEDGVLWLIDPYPPGRIPGVNTTELAARRVVGRVRNGEVVWERFRSHVRALDWQQPLDFLFIDGDHTYEGCSRDWRDWSPHVEPGGLVLLHDAVPFPGGWLDDSWGPARVLEEFVVPDPEWLLIDTVDSLAVLQRQGGDVGSSARAGAS